ncbi:phage holin family protein [Plastorhodobacter daqingensis]|uniref:Phage holin family protein n=1 Tax=Plastorhodobacter daqingensis TaxID=1387281 RepID=A0ABW2UMT5_9RHOB
MMIPSPQLVKDAAARAARQAALSAAGMVAALVGAGFLTSALWIFIARWEDSLMASLAVGVLFIIVAAILLAMGKKAGKPRRGPEFHSARHDPLYEARMASSGASAPPRGEYPPLLEAFLFGLNTAAKVRGRRSR